MLCGQAIRHGDTRAVKARRQEFGLPRLRNTTGVRGGFYTHENRELKPEQQTTVSGGTIDNIAFFFFMHGQHQTQLCKGDRTRSRVEVGRVMTAISDQKVEESHP